MAKIITDPLTKVSKGYGFVKFMNLEEANKALIEMNGQLLGDKVIKVSQAHQKTKEETQENEEENQT
jgi:RNA recognition motif-containing protein